jgi:hypothetical protein
LSYSISITLEQSVILEKFALIKMYQVTRYQIKLTSSKSDYIQLNSTPSGVKVEKVSDFGPGTVEVSITLPHPGPVETRVRKSGITFCSDGS